MSAFAEITKRWEKKFEEVCVNPSFQRLLNGNITRDHYAALLRQIFHHARENPQIQTLATAYFRGHQRKVVKMFYKHAVSEIGHDELALNDLRALGVPTQNIPFERPLPATTALLAFAFYQIQHLDPIGYLGYLFHLEFMPTKVGRQVLEGLTKIGIPREAMTFIQDHTTIDVGHNKLMEAYVEELVVNDQQIETIAYCASVTADLYTRMIESAFAWAEAPYSTGVSPYERRSQVENVQMADL